MRAGVTVALFTGAALTFAPLGIPRGRSTSAVAVGLPLSVGRGTARLGRPLSQVELTPLLAEAPRFGLTTRSARGFSAPATDVRSGRFRFHVDGGAALCAPALTPRTLLVVGRNGTLRSKDACFISRWSTCT